MIQTLLARTATAAATPTAPSRHLNRLSRRRSLRAIATTAAVAAGTIISGCGGGDNGADANADTPAPAAAPSAATPPAEPSSNLVQVEWITVDQAAQTVTIDLVAGETAANNRWNFNGHSNGEATVVVPAGYAVTLNFENRDPINYHSVGVLERAASYPAIFTDPVPVFDGAITTNATSMTESTPPADGSETIAFTASSAGEFALVCPVPAHAVTGMWIGFSVSEAGEAGLRT